MHDPSVLHDTHFVMHHWIGYNIFMFSFIQDIDYGITLEESGIEVEAEESSVGVAKGKNALTVLDNPETREQFTNQLLEVTHRHEHVNKSEETY